MNKYQVVEIRPRKFANEKTIYYGSTGDIQRTWYEIRERGLEARYSVLSNHRTLEAARRSAEAYLRTERRSAHRNAYQLYASIQSAAENVAHLGPDNPAKAALRLAL